MVISVHLLYKSKLIVRFFIAMATTNFNIRLDTELRDQAFPVLEHYGLSASLAFKLFLKQVAETKKVPLSFDYAQSCLELSEPMERSEDAID